MQSAIALPAAVDTIAHPAAVDTALTSDVDSSPRGQGRKRMRRDIIHSMCDLCSKVDAAYERLRGNNWKQAVVIRQQLQKDEEHEEAHRCEKVNWPTEPYLRSKR